jgi:bifunctional DNA-binding transcriptional regulator/antitoxin component of YhaV-PrlF toxin-antitoxin module
MQAIEFETQIDKNGHIYLPEAFRHAFGRFARLVVLLPEQADTSTKRRQPGSAKGILKVLSEDDEHLDDFRAYMP